jgi:hypothetical protein
MCGGAKTWYPAMSKSRAQYEQFDWWLTREQIGLCLRARYQVPKELPSSLLTLVKKLDAVEGNRLLRECKERLRAKTPHRNDSQ